jgi:hypothetical protein
MKELIQNVTFYRFIVLVYCPLAVIGVFTFLVFACTHWTAFVGESASIVNWLLTIGGLSLYLVLAWLAVRVFDSGLKALTAFSHALIEARNKWIQGSAIKNRIELLSEQPNYVVYKQDGRVIVQPVLPASQSSRYAVEQIVESEQPEQPELLPAPVMSFAQLLEIGTIQAALSEGKMLLGYTTDGMPRFGSWFDLYSCAIGGVSGSGKSTTVRFLLFQAILAGAKLIMVDPHIGDEEESLAAQFRNFRDVHILPPCDEEEKAVLKRVRWLDKEYKRRMSKGKGYPIVLVLDELNAIMRRAGDELKKELADLLLTISQEGRKFGIFAMLIGQRWANQDLSNKYGAAIRSSLSSQLAHRFTDEGQARLLIGGKNGPRCLDLPQGHYLFRDTKGVLSEMITPYTVESDGVAIQSLLDEKAGPETTPEGQKPARNQYAELPGPEQPLQLETSQKPARNTDELSEKPEVVEKMMLVLRLQSEGKSKPEIIKAIWGVSPGGSQAYELANNEYQTVLKLAYEKLA